MRNEIIRAHDDVRIKRTSSYRKGLDIIVDHAVTDVYRACNYTLSGKKNNAPQFSKRGHVAESTAAFSLLANCCSNMVDMSQVGVATDEMSFNLEQIKRNDQLRDITVKNIASNVETGYQSKVCKTPEASIKAATAKKYVDANITPLVPYDHDSKHGNISINVNGSSIKSDNYTLDDLNRITDEYSSGKIVSPFKNDKTQMLYLRAIKPGVNDAIKSSFMCSSIKEIVDYMSGKEFTTENGIRTLANMITSSIDGGVRSFIRQDVGFKTYGKKSSIAMAEIGYDTALELASFALGMKSGNQMLESGASKAGSIAGGQLVSTLFSKVGISLGSPFGIIGSIVGSKIGQSCGLFLAKSITGSSKENQTAIGKSLANQNSYAKLYGGYSESLTVASNMLINSMMPFVNAASIAVDGLNYLMDSLQELLDEMQTANELSKLNKETKEIEKNLNKKFKEMLNEYGESAGDVLSQALNISLNNAYKKKIVNFNKAIALDINELVTLQNEFNKLNVADEAREQYVANTLKHLEKIDKTTFSSLNILLEKYKGVDEIGLNEFISARRILTLMN